MAAPNSYNFTVTRDQLITDALLHIGAVGEGETPSSNAITESARVLNMLLKLRAHEIPLWTLRRGIVLPVTEVSSINTTSHVVIAYETTTILTAEASGQTTLSVTSSTNMAVSDQIGIEIDDGTMHWTTISSIPDGTSVIVATGLDAAAASGNRVFWYTASADRIPTRPLRIINANILELTNNSSWEIKVESRQDYFNLGNRTSPGTPNRLFYDPILGDRTADPTSTTTWYGIIYVYPRFESGDRVIEFTYQEPMQDVDATGDNVYWPQEFYLPLWLELAALLGPRYGVPKEERDYLNKVAEIYRLKALETIFEEGSVYLQPGNRHG